MIIIFSVMLSPIFFIIYYAAGEYIFPSKNASIVFAFCAMLISVYVYYTIRKEVRQLNKEKREIKDAESTVLSQLLLLEGEKFAELFPKNSLCSNSYKGVNEENVLCHLRKAGCKKAVEIYSLNGITQGATDLFNLLGVKYNVHPKEEIIALSESLRLPRINKPTHESIFVKMLNGIKSSAFRKFAIKYGVILSVVGLITPYKAYYLIFGTVLFLYGLLGTFLPKISQQNRIPYPRS